MNVLVFFQRLSTGNHVVCVLKWVLSNTLNSKLSIEAESLPPRGAANRRTHPPHPPELAEQTIATAIWWPSSYTSPRRVSWRRQPPCGPRRRRGARAAAQKPARTCSADAAEGTVVVTWPIRRSSQVNGYHSTT